MKKKGKKRLLVSYHKKPDELSVDEWQKALRRQIVRDQPFIITKQEGEHLVFTDYTVKNQQSAGVYKVAIRSPGRGLNFCTCMDFKINDLGTCKHVEAVLLTISRNKKLARLLTQGFTPSYSSLFLKYNPTRHVRLRIGTDQTAEFQKLATHYFDSNHCLLPESFDTIETFIQEAAKISPHFRCYSDAMEFILTVRANKKRAAYLDNLFKYATASAYFEKVIKTTLYPYQHQGILFAVRAGRALIADDMGLGKTIQAIAVAELLRKELGITHTLIVCPTSLKYQWKSEIGKFTDSSVTVIEGDALTRKKQYQDESFYKIVSYNTVMIDSQSIKNTEPDLVILDEAQRIKNWKTRTAREVKKITSPYALVLTGTPLENKLEDLYSIIQFIDPFRLGSLYKFLEQHQIKNDHGKVVGYKNLNAIGTVLSDIVIRRRKKEVLAQLPERVDKHLFVPMTQEQVNIHEEYAATVSRLVNKWKRFGFLDEKDRQRLLLSLNCMRMVCDSTYILDQQTRFDTKITEVMNILDDILVTNTEKVVIFSQWERMTRLVVSELAARGVGYEYLHGGVPSEKRKDLIHNFHELSDRRIFVSTDAGGVGLNLQCASFLINLDIPWNPAVLEQRIARIHRLGQKRNVQIINLVSQNTIEHRMLDVLRFKSSLFSGVLDHGEDQIFMGSDKFKQFMKSVETITAQKKTAQPVAIQEAQEIDNKDTSEEEASGQKEEIRSRQTTAQLFTVAADFFGILAKTFSDTTSANDGMSLSVHKDEKTGKQYIKIPLENEQVVSKAVAAFTGLVSLLKKP